MKCLDCGNEMQQGIVEGYGQGGHSCYEFTSDEEKRPEKRTGTPELLHPPRGKAGQRARQANNRLG